MLGSLFDNGQGLRKNNEKPLFSVIVIFYNLESVAKRCLDSLIEMKYYNYELILVDDGSVDNTFDILKEFEKNCSVHTRVFQKENGGPGSARNYGVKKASGKWIVYVDGDDIVSPSMLVDFANAISRYECDIVIGLPAIISAKKASSKRFEDNSGIIGFVQSEELVDLFLANRITESPWAKAIRVDIARRISFPENCWYEDVAWSGDLYSSIENAVIIDKVVYGYCMNEESVTHRSDADIRQSYDFYNAINHMLEPFEASDEDNQDLISFRRLLEYARLYMLLLSTKGEDAKEMSSYLIDEARSHISKFIFSVQIPLIQRLRLLLFVRTPRIYAQIMLLYSAHKNNFL